MIEYREKQNFDPLYYNEYNMRQKLTTYSMESSLQSVLHALTVMDPIVDLGVTKFRRLLCHDPTTIIDKR